MASNSNWSPPRQPPSARPGRPPPSPTVDGGGGAKPSRSPTVDAPRATRHAPRAHQRPAPPYSASMYTGAPSGMPIFSTIFVMILFGTRMHP